MNEDAFYRASSQFRFWSFTPEKLAELRATSNALATDNIKALQKRRKEAGVATPQPSSANGTPAASDAESKGDKKNGQAVEADEVDCMTVEEEVDVLNFYCQNLLELGTKEFKYGHSVTATAIQFLKRFYLTHSLMDYPPKRIMPTALFLANKTDSKGERLDDFVFRATTKISGLQKLTSESVLEPEFLFTQALRFHFDVRHPFRAIKGIWLECLQLIAVISGKAGADGWCKLSDSEIQERLLQDSDVSPKEFERRLEKGYGAAKNTLRTVAPLSDAYFHYSPSQIAFASWYMYDPDFIKAYLDIRLAGAVAAKEKHSIVDTIAACAKLLSDFNILEAEEIRPMNQKMMRCIKINAKTPGGAAKAKKRANTGTADEHAAKKRKMEREKWEKEANDLFGPSLK